MHARFSLILALACSAFGCGASVENADSGDASGTDSGAETSLDTGLDVEVDAGKCRYPNGVFMCSMECGLGDDPPKCGGCEQFKDVAGTVMTPGFCLNDADKMEGSRCPKCRDATFLCAQHVGDDQALCVSPLFCETAKKMGFSSPCYWQDLTPWSGAVAIPDVSCPAPGLDLCGGGCGTTCPTDNFCFGRSPTHPIGICGRIFRPGGGSTGCRRGSFGCNTGEACLTFKTADAQQALADEHGVCVDATRCKSIRGVIPGGVRCGGPGGAEL